MLKCFMERNLDIIHSNILNFQLSVSETFSKLNFMRAQTVSRRDFKHAFDDFVLVKCSCCVASFRGFPFRNFDTLKLS